MCLTCAAYRATPNNKLRARLSRSGEGLCFTFCGGLPAYGLLPYIFYTAFFKWTGFAFSGVVDTVFTGAIRNAPMFKLVIYPCACAALVVAHGVFIVFHRATPPKFLLEIKKGQTVRSPAPWGYANILLWVCRRSTSGQLAPKSTIYSRDSGGILLSCRKIHGALLVRYAA